MIEINLLPEEHRQAEGTPPARFFAIIAGVVVACGIGFWIGKFYLVDIPTMKTEIAIRDKEIEALKVRQEKMKIVEEELRKSKDKATTLNDLIHSRIMYGRLLSYLMKAVPDGVWFRSFNVLPDNGPPPADLTPLPNAKRYMISLTGYTTAKVESFGPEARKDQDDRLAELMNNLKSWFCDNGVDDKQISIFLGARFRQPRLISKTVTTLPTPMETDAEVLKALAAPKEGLEFSMTMSFELPRKGS